MGLKEKPETFMRHFNFLNEINHYIISKNGILTNRQRQKFHKRHGLPYSVFIAAKRLGYFKEIRRYNYITTVDSFSMEQVREIIEEKRLRHGEACKKSLAKKKRKDLESSTTENKPTKKTTPKMKDLTPRHQQLIKAENVVVEKLPTIIRSKIALFNLNYSNYLNSPNTIRLGRLNKADKILTSLIKKELRKNQVSDTGKAKESKQTTDKTEQLIIRHRKLIVDSKINLIDLPDEIIVKMEVFNKLLVEYMVRYSEKLIEKLAHMDVELFISISSFIGSGTKKESDSKGTFDMPPPISEEQRRAMTEKTVEMAIEAYSIYRNMPFEIILKHDEKKMEDLHNKGQIDLDMVVNSEGKTIRGFISDWNKFVNDSFGLKAESKEKLKEALTDVLMEEDMVLTPKQRLLGTLLLDLGGDVITAFNLFKQKKLDIEAFKEAQANRSILRKISKKLGKFKSWVASFFKSKKVEAPQPPSEPEEQEQEPPVYDNINNPHFDCESKGSCKAPNCFCKPINFKDSVEQEKDEPDPTDESGEDFNKVPEKEYDILSEPVTKRAYSDVDTSKPNNVRRGRPSTDLYQKESLLLDIKRIVNNSERVFKVSEISKKSNVNPNKIRKLLKQLVKLKYVIPVGGDKNNGLEYRLANWGDYKQSEAEKIEKEEKKSVNQVKVSKGSVKTALSPILDAGLSITNSEIKLIKIISRNVGDAKFKRSDVMVLSGLGEKFFYMCFSKLVKKGYIESANDKKYKNQEFKLTGKFNLR